MIGRLRGQLVDRSVTGEILVDVAGVGYRVQAGPVTAARLGDLGDEVTCWIHHHIREDAQSLYGFADRTERDAFEALLGAHGVGPSLALAILSVHPPADLARILADDDVAALCLVPGVGKKTAARLLIELKNRLAADAEAAGSTTTAGPVDARGGDARADVRAALSELGYGPDEIAAATRDLPAGDVGDQLREALRRLASAR